MINKRVRLSLLARDNSQNAFIPVKLANARGESFSGEIERIRG